MRWFIYNKKDCIEENTRNNSLLKDNSYLKIQKMKYLFINYQFSFQKSHDDVSSATVVEEVGPDILLYKR
jgi:hypothetical protein